MSLRHPYSLSGLGWDPKHHRWPLESFHITSILHILSFKYIYKLSPNMHNCVRKENVGIRNMNEAIIGATVAVTLFLPAYSLLDPLMP